jgi:hypothetical protein
MGKKRAEEEELGGGKNTPIPASSVIKAALPMTRFGSRIASLVMFVASGKMPLEKAIDHVGLPSNFQINFEIQEMIMEAQSKFETVRTFSGEFILMEMIEIYAMQKLSGDFKSALTTLKTIAEYSIKIPVAGKMPIYGELQASNDDHDFEIDDAPDPQRR